MPTSSIPDFAAPGCEGGRTGAGRVSDLFALLLFTVCRYHTCICVQEKHTYTLSNTQTHTHTHTLKHNQFPVHSRIKSLQTFFVFRNPPPPPPRPTCNMIKSHVKAERRFLKKRKHNEDAVARRLLPRRLMT